MSSSICTTAKPLRRFGDSSTCITTTASRRGSIATALAERVNYAIDETITKAAMDAFAEALALADSDAVKSRVEKASICAYRCAIDPAWEVPHGQAPLEAAEAQQMRPLVKRFFELCAQVSKSPCSRKCTSIDQAKQRLRTNLGLQEGEEF